MGDNTLTLRTSFVSTQEREIRAQTDAMYQRGREHPDHTALIFNITDFLYRVETVIRMINRAKAEAKSPRKIAKCLTEQMKLIGRVLDRISETLTLLESDAGGSLPSTSVASSVIKECRYIIENGIYDKKAPKQGIFMIYPQMVELRDRGKTLHDEAKCIEAVTYKNKQTWTKALHEMSIEATTIVVHLSDF